jgi:dUTP pyrophosphatase
MFNKLFKLLKLKKQRTGVEVKPTQIIKKDKNKVLINCSYIPERKTIGSACYDLKAKLQGSIIVFRAGESHTIGTGLHIEIPEGKVGLVFMRSGIASDSWLGLANGVGVIDSDYRGEIKLNIRNYSPGRRYVINNGDRVAQLLIVDYFSPELINSKNLSVTERDAKGFGSTGVR